MMAEGKNLVVVLREKIAAYDKGDAKLVEVVAAFQAAMAAGLMPGLGDVADALRTMMHYLRAIQHDITTRPWGAPGADLSLGAALEGCFVDTINKVEEAADWLTTAGVAVSKGGMPEHPMDARDEKDLREKKVEEGALIPDDSRPAFPGAGGQWHCDCGTANHEHRGSCRSCGTVRPSSSKD